MQIEQENRLEENDDDSSYKSASFSDYSDRTMEENSYQ